MPFWILHIWVLVCGVLAIVHGVALLGSDAWIGRWLSFSVGGLFVLVSTIGLILGSRNDAISLNKPDRPIERAVATFMILFGGIGAVYIAISYPFFDPYAEDQAWWIGWVYFAGLVWTVVLGVILWFDSYRPGDK